METNQNKKKGTNPVCECTDLHRDVIELTRKEFPDDTKLYDLSDFFKVFGDSTRIKILWALDKNELCVCDLVELLGMTKSAISHQLNSLRIMRLVNFRKSGKNVFYSLADEHVRDILEKGLEHINER